MRRSSCSCCCSCLPTVAAAGAALAAYVFVIRPWHLKWGASADEARQQMPGDDLVPSPLLETTRAISIDAPAERVWQWLLQLGTGRGGWYSYDFLENMMGLGVHSARTIVPELQSLAVGDVIPAAPPPYIGFRVQTIDPPKVLATATAFDMIAGLMLEPGGPLVGRRLDASWTFVLAPLGEARCRLIARLRGAYAPGLVSSLFVRCLLEPMHFLMERRMLLGIKQRAEAAATG